MTTTNLKLHSFVDVYDNKEVLKFYSDASEDVIQSIPAADYEELEFVLRNFGYTCFVANNDN